MLTRCFVLLFGLFALCACGTKPLTHSGANIAALGGDLRLPMASIQSRRFQTVVRQAYDFSCGSAALATLLSYHYGDRQDEPAVFRGMWLHGDRAQIRRLGFSLLDMKRYLEDRSLDGAGYRIDLEKLEAAHTPGIALLNIKGYRHFVVVKGANANSILIGDPALGIRTMSRSDFVKAWNGVYFVLTDGGKSVHKPAFNDAGDWSLVATARIPWASIPEPIDVLSLMRPSYGEF